MVGRQKDLKIDKSDFVMFLQKYLIISFLKDGLQNHPPTGVTMKNKNFNSL